MPSTRPHRAVLFDLDGTLLDSRHAIVEAVAAGIEEVASREGQPYHADRDLIVRALGLPADEYFRRVLPPKLLHCASAVKTAATRHEVASLEAGQGQLFECAQPSLNRLRASGYRLGVVSNAQVEYFRAALEHLDLDRSFEHRECYEELPPELQPPFKERLVERALESLGVEGANAFMVGDRAEDLAAGRSCGCRSIGVLHGFGDEPELAAADSLARNLEEATRFILESAPPHL